MLWLPLCLSVRCRNQPAACKQPLVTTGPSAGEEEDDDDEDAAGCCVVVNREMTTSTIPSSSAHPYDENPISPPSAPFDRPDDEQIHSWLWTFHAADIRMCSLTIWHC